ncbi:UNVERIFIED_CONTAM: hypothetical protein HHA_232280 [Hammondia hammondi]|eukprot:XP_008885622.1 hypothetical protein HHA_232280 [Hammondia hammondi]
MGAVCGKSKNQAATKDSHAANADSQTPMQKLQTARAAVAAAAANGAETGKASHLKLAGQMSVAARSAATMEEFKPGDGDGVYLLESPEGHVSLVSQYAHKKPTEQGTVLLQVKAPPYKPIPESRFKLQSGKRILRQNIEAMKDTPEAKAKYCEAVMDFVRLANTYNGFLWASSHLGQIKQPFTILYLEPEQRAFAEPEQPAVEVKDTVAIGKDALEKHEEKAAETDADKEGEQSAPKNESPESGQDATAQRKVLVQYLGPESSVPHRLLATCGILPLPLDKAKELIEEGKVVDNVEEIKTIVTEAGGFFGIPAA